MAHMIPTTPKESTPESQEKKLFESLSRLPDEYYVFHSFRVSLLQGNRHIDREIDFLVFCPEKGFLCIEAKSGQVFQKDGEWFYGNNLKMDRSPYEQSLTAMHRLFDLLKDKQIGMVSHEPKTVIDSCQFRYCVWFVSVSKENFLKNPVDDTLKTCTLLHDDLKDPTPKIEQIFQTFCKGPPNCRSLDAREIKKLVNGILCPTFNFFPITDVESGEERFAQYIEEQIHLLDFLEEQPIAIINGMAGTGKTCIAIEKVKRLANKGENTLFLCFNKQLSEYVSSQLDVGKLESNGASIEAKTVDGFVATYKHKGISSYRQLIDYLNMNPEKFNYKNVVVDEGQDFCNIREDLRSDLLDCVQNIVECNEGSFFVFYDENQFVVDAIGNSLVPKLIQFPQCKLVLRKNCRNTVEIAQTAWSALEKKPPETPLSIKGTTPELCFYKNTQEVEKNLNLALTKLESEGIQSKNIVILTLQTEDKSSFKEVRNNIDANRYHEFTTCRKFKGLEAIAVIVLDAHKEQFLGNKLNKLLFYVGASRARQRLIVFSDLTDDDIKEIVEKLKTENESMRKSKLPPKKAFLKHFNLDIF